jgi:hypothetical protein
MALYKLHCSSSQEGATSPLTLVMAIDPENEDSLESIGFCMFLLTHVNPLLLSFLSMPKDDQM